MMMVRQVRHQEKVSVLCVYMYVQCIDNNSYIIYDHIFEVNMMPYTYVYLY